MKKILVVLALIAILGLVACSKEEASIADVAVSTDTNVVTTVTADVPTVAADVPTVAVDTPIVK